MKRKLDAFGKWLTLAALVLFVGFAVTACKPQNDDPVDTPSTPAKPADTPVVEEIPEGLLGKWVSSWGEKYTISKTAFDAGEYSYAGNEMVYSKLTDDSGMLYFKYTRAYIEVYTDPEDSAYTKYESWTSKDGNYTTVYEEPEDSDNWDHFCMWYAYLPTAPDVGKWYAVYYYDLTATSVKISGAYKYGGVTSTVTLEEAKAEFTVANGYFAGKSECTKSK